MKNSFVETIVGALVILVAAVFFTYIYRTTGLGANTGGYSVVAEFDHIDGLPMGADVRLSGIKVGTVTDQKLDKESYRALVTMNISKAVKLPTDSNAKIASEGLLGGAYITLDPGGAEEMLADGGKIIYTQSSVDIMGLIGKAIFNSGGK